MDSSGLIEILNCARLRRLSNLMRDKKIQIGIPVGPADDLVSIGAKFVLGVLQDVIPRKQMRSYLMKIIAFDEVAKILRDWRSDDEGQTIMHLAVALYDLDFVKLVADKCGEDLFTVQSEVKELPISYLYKSELLVQCDQVDKAVDYHISKVPMGLSWLRSSIFKNFLSCNRQLMTAVLEKPIIASEIIKEERKAIISLYTDNRPALASCHRKADLARKMDKIFLLSGPTFNQIYLSNVILSPYSGGQHKAVREILDLFEEISQMKQITKEDRGYIITMANMTYDYINGYTPLTTQKVDENIRQYLKFLWCLNDCGLLPNSPKEDVAMKSSECEKFLLLLAKQGTSGLLQMEKFNFQNRDMPAIYKYFINKYLENRFSRTAFRSTEDLAFKFPFLDLPFDMMTLICSHLPYITCNALSLASKQLLALKKSSSIWRAKFEQYFPYEAQLKDYSEISFSIKYKNKFKATQIYVTRNDRLSKKDSGLPSFCDMYSIELNRDELIYTSRHHKTLTLVNLETNDCVTANDINEPTAARVYGDKVFIMKHGQIEIRNKTNLEITSQFPRFKPRTTLPHFALSNNWLISSDGWYDCGTGQMLDSWDQDLHSVLIRDQMCYGIDGKGSVCIRDLRQSDSSQQRVSIPGVDKFSSINVFDGKIYTAGASIDIFDTRYLQEPLSMTASRSVGPCDSDDFYAIDLVNMNVWGSQISWDLIDNKWEKADIGDYYNIRDKICNGKYLAVTYVGLVRLVRLNGSAFPYGDFKLNRYIF